MIKRVFSAFIIGIFTLSIQAMEQDSSALIDILPNEIKCHILFFIEPKDVAAFALTDSKHAQLVAEWLENPQVIGNVITKIAARTHRTVIKIALICGKESAAQWLNSYRHNKPDIQQVLNHYLGVHIADLQAIRFLVKSGANINRQAPVSRETPLITISHYDEKSPHIAEIAKFLLDNNAQLNLTDFQGNTALHIAIAHEQKEIALMLIQAGADINLANGQEATPLLLALFVGSIPIAESLIAKNVNVNQTDAKGYTPVMKAITSYWEHSLWDFHIFNIGLNKDDWESFLDNLITIIELLLKAGANVDAQNTDGFTALDIAIRLDRQEVIKLLKKYDAKVSKE
jgi:ankyrin repeat protein